MEKIASFQVDHLRLLRGVYVSRRDVTPSGDIITTFDIRMTEPNRQEALTPETLHAMEHLAATYLRNRPDWKDRVVYWDHKLNMFTKRELKIITNIIIIS